MSDWKNVQYKEGKFKTGSGGGGGSSTFAGLDDVNFSNIQSGQVPKYNSQTEKWENANESGGETVTDVQVDGVSVVNQQGVAEIPAIPDGLHHYSTTEQVIGTWIDGKPVYEKTISVGALTKDTNWHSVAHGISNIDIVVNVKAITSEPAGTNSWSYPFPTIRPNTTTGICVTVTETNILYMNNWEASLPNTYVTIQYTKTTD